MSNAAWSFLGVLVGAIVGAVGTYFANLRIEKIKAQDTSTSQEENLKLMLKLELEACQSGFDELKRDVEDKSMFMVRWMNIIDKSIRDLETFRGSFYLLEDKDLQNSLFRLVTDTSLFMNDLRVIESWWGDLQKNPPLSPNGPVLPEEKKIQEEHLKEQRRLKLVELVDLKRRIGETIRDLS